MRFAITGTIYLGPNETPSDAKVNRERIVSAMEVQGHTEVKIEAKKEYSEKEFDLLILGKLKSNELTEKRKGTPKYIHAHKFGAQIKYLHVDTLKKLFELYGKSSLPIDIPDLTDNAVQSICERDLKEVKNLIS